MQRTNLLHLPLETEDKDEAIIPEEKEEPEKSKIRFDFINVLVLGFCWCYWKFMKGLLLIMKRTRTDDEEKIQFIEDDARDGGEVKTKNQRKYRALPLIAEKPSVGNIERCFTNVRVPKGSFGF